ncbi:NAD(P)H-dependent oxidoreductase [Oceanobacillus iheyensis]|nr:NAD(P)H-dependent oxidoreductase [Oceanobacillus iheyensis]
MKIMTLLGSSRRDGNTEYLVNKAVEGIKHTEIYLREKQIEPIIDQRHVPGGFDKVEDEYEALFFEFLEQDIIIFVTPLYWFGMSAQMKAFIDRWSQYMQDKRINFKEAMKGKKIYFITAGENPHPRTAALPLILQFQAICEYLGMEFTDYIIAKGNKPKEVVQDTMALAKASLWNEELKNTK